MGFALTSRSNINFKRYWTIEVYIDVIAQPFHKPKIIYTKMFWMF
jgi:hypothetical protein